MCILDDPMLALIARFVIKDIDNINISDQLFLQQQLIELKNHTDGLPQEQRHSIAMEWIKEHAERYRQEWDSKTITERIFTRRCTDCPIINNGTMSFCVIHKKWNELLEAYSVRNIESEEYIKETLDLLTQHKNRLKISTISPNI